MRVLVTGGAGFIGANFVRQTLAEHPDVTVTVLDALTYAGTRASLESVADRIDFVHGDIADLDLVDELCSGVDAVVHFAADTHVDNSLADPWPFVQTNIVGTFSLLQSVRPPRLAVAPHLDRRGLRRPGVGRMRGSPRKPRTVRRVPVSSATKASSDMLVRAWTRSFGVRATISNCSNNYGPYQHVEKFIPRQITNLIDGVRPRLYGAGGNIRDWIHVEEFPTTARCGRFWSAVGSGRPT